MALPINHLGRSLLLGTGLALSLSAVGASEDTEETLQALQINSQSLEPEVSATRTGASLEDTPRSVSVISAEQIAEHPSLGGIQSLLAELPGIEFARSGGLGGQLVMRGFNSNDGRLVLAIDGDRYRGRSTLEFNMLDPNSIERIEVIRGPAAVLYGSDAMTGVINIITRKSMVDSSQPFSLTPKIRAAEWNSNGQMFGGRAELIGGGNGFDVLFGVHQREAGDYTSPQGTVDNSSYRMRGADFRIGYSPTELSRWELSGRYENVVSNRGGGLGAAPGAPLLEVSERPIVERSLRLGYSGREFGALADSLDTSLYVRDFYTDIYQTNRKNAAFVAQTQIQVDSPTEFGGHLTALKTLGAHQLSYGGDFYLEEFDGRQNQIQRFSKSGALLADSGWNQMERDTSQTNFGLFINDTWTLNEQLVLSGALRSDWIEAKIGQGLASENQVQHDALEDARVKRYHAYTGSLGAVYKLTPNWHLFANYSSSFRAPSGQTMVSTSVSGTITTLPNTNLNEETSLTSEVGLRWYGQNSQMSLSAYQSDYDDLIALVVLDTDLRQRQNISKAQVRGVELDGKVGLSERWSLAYAATYSRGTDKSSGTPLPNIAPLTGRLALRYQADGWYSESVLRAYKGKTRIDKSQEQASASYAMVDLYAGMELSRVLGDGWQDWHLTGGVENLFDNVGRNPVIATDINYADNLVGNSLVEPGRSAVLKLTVDY
jgi:hemoglobin/transferrin/lactoferrin receptor protein